MSRIDEALKRASQGPLARNAGRIVEVRRADDRVLDEYPVESRVPVPNDRAERPERRVSSPPARPVAPAVEPPPPARLRVRPGMSEKLVIAHGCDPVSLEQYRRLAAALHEAQVEKGLKTVVVTSALPKEGKTLTAVNLAFTFTESYGRRVLLVDADLRAPSVHSVVGIENEKGLGDVLKADSANVPVVPISSLLSVLPAGRPDKSPLAGISSERMRLFLQESAARYDWVILDTPPLGVVSDAQLLTGLTQAAVFVIRAGSTPFAAIDRALAELGPDFVVGTVLNAVEEGALPPMTYYGSYHRRDDA